MGARQQTGGNAQAQRVGGCHRGKTDGRAAGVALVPWLGVEGLQICSAGRTGAAYLSRRPRRKKLLLGDHRFFSIVTSPEPSWATVRQFATLVV